MSTILVTGGAGFSGSHVVDLLIGHDELSWKPSVNIPEGLKRTVDFFQERLP